MLNPILKQMENRTNYSRLVLLGLRLFTLVVLITALSFHMRSVRVFRWERSVSGGVLITFSMAVLGLALCAGTKECGSVIIQVYLSSLGAFLLFVNAIVLWRRWRQADPLTHAVAELLQTLGMPIRRHMKIKIFLSAIAAVALMADTPLTLMRK